MFIISPLCVGAEDLQPVVALRVWRQLGRHQLQRVIPDHYWQRVYGVGDKAALAWMKHLSTAEQSSDRVIRQ